MNDHPRDPAVTFPGADHLQPTALPDTEAAVNVLYDALDAGASPDEAIGALAQKGLHLEQANAFALLASVQKFRQKQQLGDRLASIVKDMPTEITPTSMGFIKTIKLETKA